MSKPSHHTTPNRLHRLPLHLVVIIGFVFLLFVATAAIFIVKKPVAFSYAGASCVPQITLLPQYTQQPEASSFEVIFKDTYTVANTPLVSLSTCFAAIDTPDVGSTTVRVSPGGWPILAKQFDVQVGDAPVARTTDFIDTTVATTRPLEISLSAPDEVYDYAFTIDKKVTDCQHRSGALSCDITQLDLGQGKDYQASLSRSFDKRDPQTIAEGDIATLLPLKLEESSIAPDATVYDKPSQVVFRYEKPLEEAVVRLERTGDGGGSVDHTIELRENNLVVLLADELPRNADFRLVVDQAVATDGSAIAEPYVVAFKTSGGPKVTGVSIGSFSAPTAATVTVTFDQPIAKIDEALKKFSATGVGVSLSIQGNQAFFTYGGAGLCQAFSLKVAKGLENEFGVIQDQDWTFGSRTQCYTTAVIGTSKQGRAIVAYSFGSGSKTILFHGALHGNERNTKLLMDAWISELEAKAGDIPAGVRVVVIPVVNPDGYAAGTRTNSANVDLNRNFNTTDWKSDIQTVNGEPFKGGGGPEAESEPESKVLANYTRQLGPHLTLSYHSVAGYAIANTCGNSSALAATYSQLTGYRNMTGVAGAFAYEITGTYDDWLCQRLGRQSVLIELATSFSTEFERNRAAMWAMVRS